MIYNLQDLRCQYRRTADRLIALEDQIKKTSEQKFRQHDKDNTGYISMGEYLRHFFECETESRDYFEIREQLEKKVTKFDNIDANKDGLLSLKECVDFQLSFLV